MRARDRRRPSVLERNPEASRWQATALAGHLVAAEIDQATAQILCAELLPPQFSSAAERQRAERKLKPFLTPHGKWFLRLLYKEALPDDVLARVGVTRTFDSSRPLTRTNIIEALARSENVVLARGSAALSTTERGRINPLVDLAVEFELLEIGGIRGNSELLEPTPLLMRVMEKLGVGLGSLTLKQQEAAPAELAPEKTPRTA